MSDAEFIDDRGEAGPEDNAEWLRWAAETYASAVAKGGCYAPEPDWDVDSISPGLLEAATEIERLRARVEALKETLGLLVDHQNGCPLPSYADEWNRAMAQAKDLLETAP
jgi:hypothetical protein